jgi:hypothetical protein
LASKFFSRLTIAGKWSLTPYFSIVVAEMYPSITGSISSLGGMDSVFVDDSITLAEASTIWPDFNNFRTSIVCCFASIVASFVSSFAAARLSFACN